MKNKKNITLPLSGITDTVKQAVNSALLQHKAVGNKIAFWRDGKIVHETPTFEGAAPPQTNANTKPNQKHR